MFLILFSKLAFPGLLFMLVLAAGYGAFTFFSDRFDDANIVHASGRIETLETHITAPAATRVTSVNVKEGDSVRKGQLIIKLDSENLQRRIDASATALKAAQRARRATDSQVAAVQHQVSKARAKSQGLFAKIFSSKAGRERQSMELRSNMMQAKMMSMQAQHAVASVQVARSEAVSKLSYFNITSPIDGSCSIRSAQPGELVAAGQVMLTLVSPKFAYLRGFVPASDLDRIKIGQSAEVFLDSSTTAPLSGRVTSIDKEPSFTPENVYFKKDRVRQVFGIKISIDNKNGLAKPGMPAEAKILLSTDRKVQ